MKPSIGRICIVRTLRAYNGSHEHPAVINRVWGDNDPADAPGSSVCVNVTVLPDSAAPFSATSVLLFQTRDEAEADSFGVYAWWPERQS